MLRVLRFAVLAGGVLFLCFASVLLSHLAASARPRGADAHHRHLDRSQFEVVSGDADADASVDLLHLPLRLWRVSTVIAFLRDPAPRAGSLDAFFICLLLLAECYAFVVLLLGYLQMLWPLRRAPVPLPDDPEQWPAVDLLIPTHDEPLSVVRFTALAAMNIDWPAEKLNVYILDDGRRDEFRAFAEEAGIGYMSRDSNEHAKAGNINYALQRVNSPFVAVFDCDHVPTRSFLQLTMGWFLRDQKLAMLQTPHHFYSPDPFERNLDQFRTIPNEDELFYGVVQDGNDFWNATFFCGSCAVLRRSALDQVGGVAVETVTEDAHTSLRLQSSGWNTAYINIPQAAGLATERLSGHIRQRIRWARGMVQILRIENPLFAPGLKPAQRLCYFNAMAHFLYALPRLIFLTAPLIYLVFGITNIPGLWIAIVAYALPHLVLSNLDHLAHPRATSALFLERDLRDRAGAVHSSAHAACAHQSQAGQVQRHREGRRGRPGVLRRAHRAPIPAAAGVQLLRLCSAPFPGSFNFQLSPCRRGSSFVNWPAHLYDGSHPGTIVGQRAVDALQPRHPRRRHRGRMGEPAAPQRLFASPWPCRRM